MFMVENEQSNAIGFAFAIKKEINAKDAKKALKISFSRQRFWRAKTLLAFFCVSCVYFPVFSKGKKITFYFELFIFEFLNFGRKL